MEPSTKPRGRTARNVALVFLLNVLLWIAWLTIGWYTTDDIGRAYLPFALWTSAPFLGLFLIFGLCLVLMRQDPKPDELTPDTPFKLPAPRWRELPSNERDPVK